MLELLPPAEQHAFRLLVRLDRVEAGDHGLSLDVLESLHGRGLATAGPVYRALPPDVALGDTLLRQQESLEAARQMVAALSEEYRNTTRQRSAEHLVEIVVGAGALRQRLREMQDSAREEILWFCRANPIAMQGPENEEEGSALDRGVRYRAIYERELLEKPGELASIMESVGHGEEARTLPTLPVRLAIADRSLAICPLVPDAARGLGEPTAALIRSSELLDALVALFDRYWEVATPLGGPSDRPELLESEVLLLSLVVSGMPDKSIATQVGVSKRTVQRRLERLMGLAGVDTRTGLAFQAARRGWLT
jgi:DNA-binding CsgD family transcriptional regulator